MQLFGMNVKVHKITWCLKIMQILVGIILLNPVLYLITLQFPFHFFLLPMYSIEVCMQVFAAVKL